MRYKEGQDRHQSMLFPMSFDEYIAEDNPVRFIDAFVETLDIQNSEFTHSQPKSTGRKAYNPSDMLKLYIYGYMNKIRSSRELEKATHINLELIWLMKNLKPDFKTIADFRKDNGKAIQSVCREFTLKCKMLDLFGAEAVMIDGSKFAAVNGNKNNYTKSGLEKLKTKTASLIQEYFRQLEDNDKSEKRRKDLSKSEIEAELIELNKKQKRYQKLLDKIAESGETQISTIDPDSRMMKDQQNRDVCYNGQIAVDTKHKLILAHDLTNESNDLHQLHNLASKSKEILEVERLKAVADKGYFNLNELKKCDEDSIETYVSEPTLSHNKKKGLFTNKEFQYDKENDVYICPAGKELTFRSITEVKKSGKKVRNYRSQHCKDCPLKSKCTKARRGRHIKRWEHEEIVEAMSSRLKANPELINQRKAMAEHPFGTLKRVMNQGYFLCKGFEKVKTEFSLSVLAYNIKRVLNILDFKTLLSAKELKKLFSAQIFAMFLIFGSISKSKNANIKQFKTL